ncbi:DNA-directed RNA polymerase subunit B'' [Candidatus Woesearchaeota archaeon]|jgi:DNA-directed RNA polymerase subunit B|nr:DNA-directed RNA polymerase subunit B'' [Candidatus Woesearchaeota archaeon]
MGNAKIIIGKYFEEQGFVESNIESFNNFVDVELQKIIEENKEIEPTIIPQNVDEYKIRLNKVWVGTPIITEADGSKRDILPIEARLRKLTYSSPMFIEVSTHINGIQRESFETQIGTIPVMLKSKYCNLNNLDKKQLIEKGEDPDDPGGYFIVNGTEKVLVNIEDLVSNKLLVNKNKLGLSPYEGKLFSEHGSFKIPHTIEKLKDNVFYLTFTRVKRVPIIVVIKALGLLKDEEIINFMSKDQQFDDVLLNLYEFANIKTEEDSLDYIAKKIPLPQPRDIRIERAKEIIDRYLLPHLGTKKEDRIYKAYNLCKMLKKFILISTGKMDTDYKDHYMNKRLKMSGDLLADLFRVNLKVLIGDLLYNFQRIVKRGKFPSIKVIIRDKLLTSRIYSSMATGAWVGGRKGISQRMARINFIDTLSHLQRVVSPLSTTQENFEARELHATSAGRLGPVETPEGTNIGLRKNLALLASISQDYDEEKLMKPLKELGLKAVK